MIVRRGGIHPLELRDADDRRVATRAAHVLVLSEDDWNLAMRSVVAVPLLAGELAVPLFQVAVNGYGYADASLTQSIGHASLGDEVGIASPAELAGAAEAAASFLGLDALAHIQLARPPARQAKRAWPSQKGIYWVDLGLDERKRAVIVTPDDHNAVASYSTALYVTSRDKARRRRWQVPVDASWAITGDVLLCPHGALELRRRPRPQSATAREMAEVAIGVRQLLS